MDKVLVALKLKKPEPVKKKRKYVKKPKVVTKVYPDGTVATGVAPLPNAAPSMKEES